MRQGELAALRWEDVDFTDKPSITVRRSADTRTKARVSTTKSGEEHMIRIGPRTVEALKAHRAWQLEEAGLLVEVRFHDLRHTVGTLALRQGAPLHMISRMLGHAEAAMTLRRCAHVLEDMREDAARAMEELF